MKKTVALSCVLDDTPAIWSSFIPWLGSAIELANFCGPRVYVHHVCSLPPGIADLCHATGVNTRAVERFDPDRPHANKIRQCLTDFGEAGTIILTDVDVVFAGPLPLDQVQAPVAGKVVDEPNPPVDVLRKVFAACGVKVPDVCREVYWTPENPCTGFETLRGNFNGGLYVIDTSYLESLGQRWSYWAGWLIDNPDLLESWQKHLDQVSFCLAAAELEVPLHLLEPPWNFPLHLNVVPGDDEPRLLHHHALLDNNLRLRPTKIPQAQAAVKRVNAALERFLRRYPVSLALENPSRR